MSRESGRFVNSSEAEAHVEWAQTLVLSGVGGILGGCQVANAEITCAKRHPMDGSTPQASSMQ
jgi:hypothetical protein